MPVEKRIQFSIEEAQKWQQNFPWLIGCNYIPASAINQLEMWQAETWDPETIDKELAWAQDLGFNALRVYLHDLLYEADKEGFLKRMDEFLEIADRHNISIMFVIFDGVWDGNPTLGQQKEPVPRVHNSGWVQSPGDSVLIDSTQWPRLQTYMTDVISHFKEDRRINSWDVFNEPDNGSGNLTKEEKDKWSMELLKKSFVWARNANPEQPITAGVWYGQWDQDSLNQINKFILENSDIISFHAYGPPEEMQENILKLQRYGRPMICTEYLARGNNNTFQTMLPFFHENKIGAINWGFVDGKTNTIYPWDSWQKQYTSEPDPWHHDIFRADGAPYSEEEVNLIKSLTKQ